MIAAKSAGKSEGAGDVDDGGGTGGGDGGFTGGGDGAVDVVDCDMLGGGGRSC